MSFSSFELRYGLKNLSPKKYREKAVRFAATLIYFLRDVFVALADVFALLLLNPKIWKRRLITASVALFVSSFVFFAATVLEQLQRQWL